MIQAPSPRDRISSTKTAAYDACIRMRAFAFVAFASASALAACGTLLGGDDDEVEPPIRTGADAADGTASAEGASGADGASSVDSGGDGAVAPVRKRVFVTRSRYTGGFGSIAAADELCKASALDAGRGGTWKAYLAGLDGTHASARIADHAYYLLDGNDTKAFDGRPTANGAPAGPIAFDEKGMDFGGDPNKQVWTGLSVDAPSARTCNGWTSDDAGAYGGFGDMFVSFDKTWQQAGGTVSCDELYRLYCFED
jgi:hypothetical protein